MKAELISPQKIPILCRNEYGDVYLFLYEDIAININTFSIISSKNCYNYLDWEILSSGYSVEIETNRYDNCPGLYKDKDDIFLVYHYCESNNDLYDSYYDAVILYSSDNSKIGMVLGFFEHELISKEKLPPKTRLILTQE